MSPEKRIQKAVRHLKDGLNFREVRNDIDCTNKF